MEKFPKSEMGWVNESTVKEYINRNYVSKEKYENLQAEYTKLLIEKTEIQNGLDYFVDDLINYSGKKELMRSAVKGGFTPEFIWKHIYADKDLYEETKEMLIAEGEILPDDDEADED